MIGRDNPDFSSDEAFNDLMGTISQVYSLRVGHTLTEDDYNAIQRFDEHFRSQDDNAIDAFHLGYKQGLREGGSADIEQMQAKLDAKQSELAVEKAMRYFAEKRKDEITEALKGAMDILARAESNASGNPEWDYVGPRVAACRAVFAKAPQP